LIGVRHAQADRLIQVIRRHVLAPAASTAVAILVLWAGVASAHDEDARVFVEPSVVAPGGGIRIDGVDFARGLELELLLDGTDADASLTAVRTDAAGGFHATIRVPTNLPPAVYAVVARSRDGDEINTNVVLDGAAGAGVPVSVEGDVPLVIGIAFGVAILAAIAAAVFTRARASRRPPVAAA
jgi:hypothetical protein